MSEYAFLVALSLICGTITIFVASRFAIGYLALREGRRGPIEADEVKQRLERIEIAVETTAIEIERIAESNRFVVKLLAERAGDVGPVSLQARASTPH